MRTLLSFMILSVSILGLVYMLTQPGLKPEVISIYETGILKVQDFQNNLGKIPQGETIHLQISLSNIGGQTITIQEIEPTHAYVSSKVSKNRITPGSTVQLEFLIQTQNLEGAIQTGVLFIQNKKRTLLWSKQLLQSLKLLTGLYDPFRHAAFFQTSHSSVFQHCWPTL